MVQDTSGMDQADTQSEPLLWDGDATGLGSPPDERDSW